MSIRIEKMVFGDLRGTPILFSVHFSFALQGRKREWAPIANDVAGEANVLDEAAFFARFGTDLPPLPEVMRAFDHRLWHVLQGGKLEFAAFRRRRPRGAAEDGSHLTSTAQAVRIPKSGTETEPASGNGDGQINPGRMPTNTSQFYLGSHSYSAGPGCGWTTEYMIQRLDDGDAWELFVTEEDALLPDEEDVAGPEFATMGQFTTEAIKEYFESVRFEISEAEWDAMGQRQTSACEELDSPSDALSESPDDYCAICGQAFDPNPFVMHEC